MTLPIRAIATDLDGTLLNDQHMLSPRTERARARPSSVTC